MAMNVIQDQNFSVHLDGVKVKGCKMQKNRGGGLKGRKALNDISNSNKPPAINTSRKQNPKNVTPIVEDVGVPKVSGRKALVDLTNSFKPITQRQSLKKKSRKNKSIPTIADEYFLHKHDKCIESQGRLWDLDFDWFLKTIGLHEDVSCESIPRKQKDENVSCGSPDSPLMMELTPEPITEDKVRHRFLMRGSPRSPLPVRIESLIEFDSPRFFSLAETS